MALDLLKTELAERVLNLKGSMSSQAINAVNQFGEDVYKDLSEKGFAIIKGYLSTDEIDKLKSEVDRLIDQYYNIIWKDETGADHRVYFADQGSEDIQKYHNDDKISALVKIYENSEKLVGFTLANRIEAKPNNLGSGGGWHRDYFLRKQTKSIVYLNDVDDSGGPFQYIQGSHTHDEIKRLIKRYDFKFNQYRYSEDEVKCIIDDNPDNLKNLLGNKGDLILVDTRGIHRGKPIEKGRRYALTNYFWSNKDHIPPHIENLNPFS